MSVSIRPLCRARRSSPRQFHPGSRLLLDPEIFLNPDELGVTATHLLAGLE